LVADLAHFYHWPPQDALALTGTELVWWLGQANRIVRRQNASDED
jgi:hypothetical protein